MDHNPLKSNGKRPNWLRVLALTSLMWSAALFVGLAYALMERAEEQHLCVAPQALCAENTLARLGEHCVYPCPIFDGAADVLQALQSQDSLLRRAAANSLEKLLSSTAEPIELIVPQLKIAMQGDDPYVRYKISNALGEIEALESGMGHDRRESRQMRRVGRGRGRAG